MHIDTLKSKTIVSEFEKYGITGRANIVKIDRLFNELSENNSAYCN